MSDADDPPSSYVHDLAMNLGRELAMTAPTGVVFMVLMSGPVPGGTRENSYTTNVADPAQVVQMLRAFADAIESNPDCAAVAIRRPGPDIE